MLLLFSAKPGKVMRFVKPLNLHAKGLEAEEFCKTKGLNTDYCILIDFSIHSGKKRLFLYDLKNDSVIVSAMVSHGCGDAAWGMDNTKTNPVFSNQHESHCSSLGKYKIGKRGYSSWGINVNYKLHGLESSNSNAYDRVIVLHSWEAIPHKEVYPNGTPEGWGCPAVSNEFMTYLDGILKDKKKDVLLWIYNN
ncbi:MAG: murein L,D-transpeptidase catalytic domain family protein [Flavobacteriales bacterium]|nr:murein L,D-transpeptidase catalytic domain family protein [Flavobacteriales bacterium]